MKTKGARFELNPPGFPTPFDQKRGPVAHYLLGSRWLRVRRPDASFKKFRPSARVHTHAQIHYRTNHNYELSLIELRKISTNMVERFFSVTVRQTDLLNHNESDPIMLLSGPPSW